MTRKTVIWSPNSVETPFCRSISEICYTTVFAATNSTGLSDLLSVRGLAHSHRIRGMFLVYFSARGLTLPHALPHVAIHICCPPHNSIQFPFQLVGGVSLWVNEGIQYAVTK